MRAHRIVSFLPAATEIVFALGLGDALVGVSHECDHPPAARLRPVVVTPALPVGRMAPSEIDAAVAERLRSGASLYHVDERQLRELAPTLILTQDLCQVCAPSGNQVSQVLHALDPKPEVLWLTPHTLSDVDDNIAAIGRATGREAAAEALIRENRARLERVQACVARAEKRPRVFCLEWIDPLYCSGHWVPEMVDLAGGTDALSRRGRDSARIAFADVESWAPEVLVVMPCGFPLAPAVEQTRRLLQRPEWQRIPAVRNDRVYAVDANAHFARPGPRLVAGIELLAPLFHPDLCAEASNDAWAKVSVDMQ